MTQPSTNAQPLRAILESFGIPPDAPVQTPDRGGFSGARVWRVTANESTWCLKAIPSHQVDPTRQAGLHRLLQHLADGGLDFVPRPRHTQSGERWLLTGGNLWQCETWLPGEADRTPHVTTDRIAAGLQALARWHQRAVSFAPLPAEQPWFRSHPAEPSPAVRERARRLHDWNPSRLKNLQQRARSRVPCELSPALELIVGEGLRRGPSLLGLLQAWHDHPVAIQPCLRDIWREHLLFTGNQVTGVIDPQACRCDTVAVDLARLLGSLCGNDRAGWRTGMAAYVGIRPLSTAEELLVGLLDQTGCLLAGLHWLETLTERDTLPQEVSPAVIGRLWHFADRLAAWSTGELPGSASAASLL